MLDEGQKSEIWEFYDGSFASLRELSSIMNISIERLMWEVNYHGRKDKQLERIKRWQKNNPEKKREHNKRALKKYYLKNSEYLKKYYKRKRELAKKTKS